MTVDYQDRIGVEDLLVQGCNLTRNSLQVKSVLAASDRHLCGGIINQQKVRSPIRES